MDSSSSFFFVAFLLLLYISQVPAQRKTFDVTRYGANPHGKSDNTKAFYNVWKEACQSDGQNVILIPKGIFLLGPMIFKGPCKGPISFRIRGVLKAPTDESSRHLDHWISFQYLDRLNINGGGSLDGHGTSAWPYNNCNKDPHCKALPVSIRFDFVTNSRINHISSIDSKNSHFNIFQCSNMILDRIRIRAPGNSPNTDGIHLSNSNNIQISNSEISTGDDCIAMLPGSKNINIFNVTCGPGHGISIGSLGGSPNEQDVAGITVKNCDLKDTLNGVRIKTWAQSYPSSVYNLTFEHINVENVSNPIIIDQQYCPNKTCEEGASKVKISDVRFRNIRGTSGTKVAVNLQCSKGIPCEKIELRDINLAYIGAGGPAISSCSNVHGVAYGQEHPPSCI
ncbi:putative Pectin lyase-like superfamily protein [Melia azedarach]|uniref:Pectin lyase-like superfamily protein n=1 Tax=Melia azedarach TaxID=155640 RepID=A0ACC1YP22_MELAZ|nr:putative Pectin lyase-like superfamily protein [Melia azedarach]